MMQLIITPHAYYKWMRKLVKDWATGDEGADGFYIDPSVSGDISSISYFKLGTGAPLDPDTGNVTTLTEEWFRMGWR